MAGLAAGSQVFHLEKMRARMFLYRNASFRRRRFQLYGRSRLPRKSNSSFHEGATFQPIRVDIDVCNLNHELNHRESRFAFVFEQLFTTDGQTISCDHSPREIDRPLLRQPFFCQLASINESTTVEVFGHFGDHESLLVIRA